MDRARIVVEKLRRISGVAECWVLPDDDRQTVLQLETESNRRARLPGIIVENEGLPEVLKRQHVVVISHSPVLRHPPGPVVVLCAGNQIVGEEVVDNTRQEETSDRNTILLGTSLILHRDRLEKTKGQALKFAYRALRFPELEDLPGIDGVISVTVGSAVHKWLATKTGWSPDDSTLGTVLIGFNESAHIVSERPTRTWRKQEGGS